MTDTRTRALDAAYAVVSRDGMARATVGAIAREAGLSRATLYRLFPGGRDDLLAAMVGREMDRFFANLAVAVADAPDFASLVEAALVFAHREIRGHAVLQATLAAEPERLLQVMSTQESRIHKAVVAFLRPHLQREAAAGRVRPGVDLDLAARYVATMGLSLMSSPASVDLEDPVTVRDTVQRELLGGILRWEAPPAGR